MNLSRVRTTIAIVCCIFFLTPEIAASGVSAGVEAGDWIEYTVHTTGHPPEDFDVTWAKIEVVNVQDTTIRTNVSTRSVDGALSGRIMVFNLTKGQVGAWFVIPANLNPSECFWDESLGRNVTIEGEQKLTFAGAVRDVTHATTPQRLKLWDKATGAFVECVDVFEDYSINATAIRTNMWGTQETSPQKGSFSIVMTIGTSAVIAGMVIIAIKDRRTGRSR